MHAHGSQKNIFQKSEIVPRSLACAKHLCILPVSILKLPTCDAGSAAPDGVCSVRKPLISEDQEQLQGFFPFGSQGQNDGMFVYSKEWVLLFVVH
jgi:hypothetical protein